MKSAIQLAMLSRQQDGQQRTFSATVKNLVIGISAVVDNLLSGIILWVQACTALVMGCPRTSIWLIGSSVSI